MPRGGGMDSGTAGLVLLGLAEVPQVMSAFLPSPATARMGFNEGEDVAERIRYLRRGEVIGSAVSMAIAASVSLLASRNVGPRAWWVTVGSAIVLGIFLLEYERAIGTAEREHNGRDQVATP